MIRIGYDLEATRSGSCLGLRDFVYVTRLEFAPKEQQM
jgi:hypothetical protein